MERLDTSSSYNIDFFGGFYHTHHFLFIHSVLLDRNCFDADEDDIALKHFSVTLKQILSHSHYRKNSFFCRTVNAVA